MIHTDQVLPEETLKGQSDDDADAVDLEMSLNNPLFNPFPGEPRWEVDLKFEDMGFSIKTEEFNVKGTTVVSAVKKAFCGWRGSKVKVDLLKNMNGEFKHGTSTLILGPPQCGKSLFLQALCGRVKHEGKIYYDGMSQKDFYTDKVCTYVEQLDNHLPLLRVKQTLDFAAKCTGGIEAFTPPRGKKVDDVEAVKEALNGQVSELINSFGLSNTVNTIVGNTIIRGVSGGERKRITVGEMLFGRKPVLLLDEISTGLDSATAYKIIKMLNASAKSMGSTIVTTLLQPEPRVVELFDNVMLMAEGQILYQGPLNEVLEYFDQLGYECPKDRDLADFVVDMTTPQRRKYVKPAQVGKAPIHLEELAKQWHEKVTVKPEDKSASMTTSQSLHEGISHYYRKGKGSSPYVLGTLGDWGIVVKRQLDLLYADRLILAFMLSQDVFMAVFTGLLFLKIPTEPEFPGDTAWLTQRFAIMFFSLLLFGLNSFALIPWTLIQRDVFLKQYDSKFIRSSSFVFSNAVAQLVPAILETLVVTSVMFWMTQMVDYSASDAALTYFKFVAIAFCFNITINSLVRTITWWSSSVIIAFLLNTLLISLSVLYSGFITQELSIPEWMRWLFWLSPVSWSIRAASLVVFDSDSFEQNGLGQIALSLFNVRTGDKWIWGAVLYLFSLSVLNLIAQKFILDYYRPGKSYTKVQSEAEFLKIDGNLGSTVFVKEQLAENTDDTYTAIQCKRTALTFKNINYTVKVKGGKKQLLFDVSGYAKPGTLTALCGASGGGKTTTLDCIAGRKTTGTLEGDILVNGLKMAQKDYEKVMAYVEQADHHSPYVTVQEAIEFAATLRHPDARNPEQVEKLTKAILDMLNLTSVREYRIGTPSTGGLAVHQLRRLTVAVEMAKNPSILFLDEVTSGLSSQAAEIVINCIKRVADSGRTVICTIHQPSREVFSVFDTMLLLQKGGRVAYFGQVSKMESYFKSLPEVGNIDHIENANPATFAIEVVDPDMQEKLGVNFGDLYESNPLLEENLQEIDQITGKEHRDQSSAYYRESPATSWTRFAKPTERWFRIYWRCPEFALIRFVVMVVFNTIVGLTFFQADLSQVYNVQTFVGVIFFNLLMNGFCNAVTCLPLNFGEKPVFLREKKAGMYNAFSYTMASTLVEIPYSFVSSVISFALFYILVGMRYDAEAIFQTFFLFYGFVLMSSFSGQLCTVLVPNLPIATIAVTGVVTTVSLFSGFLLSIDQIPVYFKWMAYITPGKYLLNGMLNAQLFCDCFVDPQSTFFANYTCNGGQQCSDVCSDSDFGCNILAIPTAEGPVIHQTVWDFSTQAFGFSLENPWRELGIVLAFVFGIRVMTGFFLHLKK